MDIKKLVKNADYVKSALSIKGDLLYTTKACKIYIPKHYTKQKLASIKSDTLIIGVFGIVVEDRYFAVNLAPTMLRITPSTMIIVKIDDVEYYEFGFEPNTVITPNINVVINAPLLYNIWNEFISNGRIPWYFNYEDLGKLFTRANLYAGGKLGANDVVMELVIAVISRDPKNPKQQFRYALESEKDLETLEPLVVKTTDVSLGATNTTAKIIGGYWDDGINSALIEPTTKKEPIEDLLRR